MVLSLEVVAESLSRGTRAFPQFRDHPGFNPAWWSGGSAKGPVVYCRFLDGDDEVARAKVLLEADGYRGYTSWSCPPDGVTEIDLIEVRVDLRGQGRRYGSQAVGEIAKRFGEPIVALSLDKMSDEFWRRLKWTAHLHPENSSNHHRTLFTSI